MSHFFKALALCTVAFAVTGCNQKDSGNSDDQQPERMSQTIEEEPAPQPQPESSTGGCFAPKKEAAKKRGGCM